MGETELRDSEYERISKLVYDLCGINLHEGKKELIKARLGKRLREGSFKSFSDYFNYITTPDGTDELIVMIDSISTNLTYFFREEKHFDFLKTVLLSVSNSNPASFLIWCAGCSTGEEPYSLAMTVKETLGDTHMSVKILATDISTRVLKTAADGIYGADRIDRLPTNILKKYFQFGTGLHTGRFRLRKDIRDMITFRRFNLMDAPSSTHKFDVIFCRNVMIYFDKATQGTLVNRFHDRLNKGGYLFVGHSESLTGLQHPFKYIQPSIYRRMAD